MKYKQGFKKIIRGENFIQDGILYKCCGSGYSSKYNRHTVHYLTDKGKRYVVYYTYHGKHLRINTDMKEYELKNINGIVKEIYKER